ncbi:PD-(D/E)XK nuclease family protein [Glutamicibacter sp. MNS18]|uniref:PD-(D/E)XK nuclease family protein n=1 Tax=Glutamicibacter sp. MNS18 TaxID=2989817 RepID=UPI0022360246|nr:PD-(D/E)XK nuclease family protein [Glutamicibacter sp. MNS18]MCW4464165.1 PD-(D/E)XK nuclease family protein [Glutamicibacter sp. MNS18]
MSSDRIDNLSSALMQLMNNDDFRSAALPKPNFWSIIHYGEASYENRYNRVFRWLLDPTGNHGLGPRVVNGLLNELDPQGPHVGSIRTQTHTETAVPRSDVQGSKYALKGRIDITLNDLTNKVYVAFECKMKSSQHTEQLGRYRTWVQQEYRHYNARYFVFLTEQQEVPDDDYGSVFPDESWVNVTFAELARIIENAVKDAGTSCGREARAIIEQFLTDQQRRTASKIDDYVHALYHQDGKPLFGDLLLHAIRSLERDASAVESYAKLKKIQLSPSAVIEPSQVHTALTAAFERLGGTSSALDSILQLCWDLRPGLQDHTKNSKTVEIIRQFAASIAGTEVEPGTESLAAGLPEFFHSVKLTQAGQAVHLTLHNQDGIYFAGNKSGVVPSVLHHYAAGDREFKANGCILNRAKVKEGFATTHDSSGVVLAAAFVNYLRGQSANDGQLCGCGRHFTGLVR